MWHGHPLRTSTLVSVVWLFTLLLLGYAISHIPDAGIFAQDDLTKILVYALVGVIPLLFLEYDFGAFVRPPTGRFVVDREDARRHLRVGLWICFVLLLAIYLATN